MAKAGPGRAQWGPGTQAFQALKRWFVVKMIWIFFGEKCWENGNDLRFGMIWLLKMSRTLVESHVTFWTEIGTNDDIQCAKEKPEMSQ